MFACSCTFQQAKVQLQRALTMLTLRQPAPILSFKQESCASPHLQIKQVYRDYNSGQEPVQIEH